MILSNQINYRVCSRHYRYDPKLIILMEFMIEQAKIPDIDLPIVEMRVRERQRNQQTTKLLRRLESALIPCKHREWLERRNIHDHSDIYSIDISKLSKQDLLDLYIFPDDHILELHRPRIIEGPVFLDRRDGELAGICIRNVSSDLEFVKDAKYTFSNFGWFLFGYDLYESNDDVFLTEGVFDALALRHHGYKAISVGSCMPHPFQLACLLYKYKNLSVCFDNDVHGYIGAYLVSELLRAPVYLPKLKDLAEHHETGGPLVLTEVTRSQLFSKMSIGISRYNEFVKDGGRLERPLPYN